MNNYEIRMTDGRVFKIEADQYNIDRESGKLYLSIMARAAGVTIPTVPISIFVAHENRWDSLRLLEDEREKITVND